MTTRSPQPDPELSQLPWRTRALLLVAGWLLVFVGLLGLVLPGIQGILTILLGAAVLSLVSEAVLRVLRRLLRPWPKAWRLLLRFRRRIYGWIQPRT